MNTVILYYSVCRKKLTDYNCTLVTTICDNCLADQAADDRLKE